MFLLDRLISRSCKALAVMIGCGQRIRAFAGSSEDPDRGAARVPPARVSAGRPQLRTPRFHPVPPPSPFGRRIAVLRAARPPSFPKGGLRWTDATS